MPVPVLIGAAALDNEVLVDSLVADVIDGLREDLHPQFGVRAYRVYRVIRTWSGEVPGDGAPTDVAAELRPQPNVLVWDGFHFSQAAAGVFELGDVRLTEVSLTYTEDQLLGRPLAKNQELLIALADAHGQGSKVRFFDHAMPPYVDRIKNMGWVCSLHRVQVGVPWAPT